MFALAEHIKWTPDLRITKIDVLFAKDDWVFMKYDAAGTHSGTPHKGRQLQMLPYAVAMCCRHNTAAVDSGSQSVHSG